jgi:carbonic anhydrase/acetyltransferase-like protein (isoleucine patch superfamily)
MWGVEQTRILRQRKRNRAMISATAERSTRTSAWRRRLVRAGVVGYLAAIMGVPLALAAWPFFVATTLAAQLVAIALAPRIYVFIYVIVAGALARVTRRAIISGKYPRDLGHEVYGPRRLYGLCWTAIYYCPPIYHAVLSVPLLKHIVLRLFGYRGSLDVTLYPDTWIRDLPLLDISEGVYPSNKATIGTNMCLTDGSIIVASIAIGRQSMVGHLVMLAPGVVLGERVEVGVGTAVGLKVRIGDGTSIGPCCVIHHGARIGQRCQVGSASHVGTKAIISDGITIPFGAVVPPRASIRTQEQANALRETAQSAGSLLDSDVANRIGARSDG